MQRDCFILLGAEFLAMLLIIVYVGAVAVLFLFVVMMLDIDFAELRARLYEIFPHWRRYRIDRAGGTGLALFGAWKVKGGVAVTPAAPDPVIWQNLPIQKQLAASSTQNIYFILKRWVSFC